MHNDLTAQVIRARNGDQQAWNDLVERYAPLIWSICRRYRLGRADTDDVGPGVLATGERLVAPGGSSPSAMTAAVTAPRADSR